MNYIYDPYKQSKYVYYSDDWDSESLEHLDLPFDIKLPKAPKIDLPKMPDLSGIAKEGKKLSKKAKKAVDNILPGNKKKKDREWKKHKWKDRKRDKNGKWIYDYGDGFPGEKKKGKKGKKKTKFGDTYDLEELSEMAKTNPALKEALSFMDMNSDYKNRINQISKGQRFLDNLANLGLAATSIDLNKAANAGKAFLNDLGVSAKKLKSDLSKRGDKIDPKTGLRLKKNKTTKDDDLAKTNPSHGMSDGTGNVNCYSCTVAYDLRKRGYDVTAVEDLDGADMNTIKKLYKNAKPTFVEPNQKQRNTENYIDNNGMYHNRALTNEVTTNLSKEPDGSSGYMCLKWSSGGGHAVAYEKENGKVLIYDPQDGNKYELSDYIDNSSQVAYFRTDNLDVNFDEAKKVVE